LGAGAAAGASGSDWVVLDFLGPPHWVGTAEGWELGGSMSQEASTSAVAARDNHLDWLRSERAAFEQHESRVGGMAPTVSDFAVGSDAYINFDEEEPVYRGISLAGPQEDSPIYEEEPVYRSIDFSRLAVAEPPARSPLPAAPDAHASWAAQKRPPLLRRQNAFATRDASWDPLGPLEQASGAS